MLIKLPHGYESHLSAKRRTGSGTGRIRRTESGATSRAGCCARGTKGHRDTCSKIASRDAAGAHKIRIGGRSEACQDFRAIGRKACPDAGGEEGDTERQPAGAVRERSCVPEAVQGMELEEACRECGWDQCQEPGAAPNGPEVQGTPQCQVGEAGTCGIPRSERCSRITAWVKAGQACKMNNMSIFLK